MPQHIDATMSCLMDSNQPSPLLVLIQHFMEDYTIGKVYVISLFPLEAKLRRELN